MPPYASIQHSREGLKPGSRLMLKPGPKHPASAHIQVTFGHYSSPLLLNFRCTMHAATSGCTLQLDCGMSIVGSDVKVLYRQELTPIAIQESRVGAIHLNASPVHNEHGDLCAVLALHKSLQTNGALGSGSHLLS